MEVNRRVMGQTGNSFKQLLGWVLVLYVMPVLYGQETAPIQLQQSSAEVLKAFEPAEDQEYELGAGDEITLTVNPASELTGKRVIGPDGRISLPLAGDIRIEGMTRAEAGAVIRSALSTYYQNVSVSLSVDRYVSNHILLLGNVERPGLISFDGTPTLLEVIARGGVSATEARPAAGLANSQAGLPASGALPELCMVYRGKQTLVTVRLRDLVKSGDPGANLRLKRDDIVFVPGNNAYVSILGSVLHPGLLRLERTSTLTELLAEAGGLNDKGGRYPKIYVVHPSLGKVAGSIEAVSYEDIVAARPVHPVLFSGDIIYVPESGFNRAADMLQKISPLISLVTVGALLR
jgi:polysaccharide export outer membrane protein